jgi:glycosyltransferase involved in cell wall biosynthesis
MRIAVDARELCGRPTGVGRYLAGLLDAWSANAAAQRHEWALVAHAQPQVPGRWAEHVHLVDGAGGTRWEQVSFPNALRASRPDVLFAPGYTAPLTVACPVVLTVHDVSFFAHPEWFSFREGARRRWLTAWSARRARTVITDSMFSQREIVKHIGIDASRLRVIPLGIEAISNQQSANPGSRIPDPGSRQEPLVLFVGSIFERRRVDRLIEAFDAVVNVVPQARLELVGENRTRHPRLDLEALRRGRAHADRIQVRSYVDDDTLHGLYARASVLAFLSEYEGFGFTPLEALAAGVAPVLLDTPIARETCGAAARYVPVDGGNATISSAIIELLTDPSLRSQIMQSAPAVLAQYDWNITAARTLQAIEEAALGR